MILNLSLRIKMFLIAVCIIVTGQIVYSYYNVKSFQHGYISSLQKKSEKLGGYLKRDVEFVLNLKIPLIKLKGLEKTLQEILRAAPELEFIEITDTQGYVLYYADHQSLGRIKPATQLSKMSDTATTQKLNLLGLTVKDTDTILPVIYKRENKQVGNINMRLSAPLIAAKAREILMDMITVILTSLLITFEFLTFFVIYSISGPLEGVVNAMRRSIQSLSPLSKKEFLFIKELNIVIERFNQFMEKFSICLSPFLPIYSGFPDLEDNVHKTVPKQARLIDAFLDGQMNTVNEWERPPLKAALVKMRGQMTALQDKVDSFADQLNTGVLAKSESSTNDLADTCYEERPDNHLPYTYIRPLIFLFVMADGFTASFFPLFVDTLYEPLWGLSKDVILGLPISVFMFFLALSMVLGGSVTDRFGWRRPLLIGIFINAVGLMITSVSQDIFQLLLFRSVTALGFGIVFIACQQFIINNTTVKARTLGMATFLAAFFSGDICGTVIGGMLADRIGYTNVFVVSGVFAMFAFLFGILIFKKETHEPSAHRHQRLFTIKDVFGVFKDREFVSVVFLQAIPAKIALIGFVFFFAPLYLNRIGALQSDIGRLIMCYGLMLVFFGPLFSKYCDKASLRKYFIFVGGMLTGLSMISFYFIQGFGSVLFIVMMMGVAHTFSVSSQASFITETAFVKKVGAGAGMGIFRFWERIGNVVGPLLMGYLIAVTDYERSIMIVGIISVLCSLLYLILIISGPKHQND